MKEKVLRSMRIIFAISLTEQKPNTIFAIKIKNPAEQVIFEAYNKDFITGKHNPVAIKNLIKTIPKHPEE